MIEQRAQALNCNFIGLDWEIEDLLSADFLKAFQADNPTAVVREVAMADSSTKISRGKARPISDVTWSPTLSYPM